MCVLVFCLCVCVCESVCVCVCVFVMREKSDGEWRRVDSTEGNWLHTVPAHCVRDTSLEKPLEGYA